MKKALIAKPQFLSSLQACMTHPDPSIIPFSDYGKESSEFVIELSDETYEIICKHKTKWTKEGLSLLLKGLASMLTSPIEENSSFPMQVSVLFRLAVPCAIFLCLNLPSNEIPYNRELEQYELKKIAHKLKKILVLLSTALSIEYTEFLNVAFKGISHIDGFKIPQFGEFFDKDKLKKYKTLFLMHEVNRSEYSILGIKDPGWSKWNKPQKECVLESWTGRKITKTYIPTIDEFILDEYYHAEENIPRRIPSLLTFQSILESCKIIRKSDGWEYPINHSLNILLFNQITGLPDAAAERTKSGYLEDDFFITSSNLYGFDNWSRAAFKSEYEHYKPLTEKIQSLLLADARFEHSLDEIDAIKTYIYNLLRYRPLRSEYYCWKYGKPDII